MHKHYRFFATVAVAGLAAVVNIWGALQPCIVTTSFLHNFLGITS